MKEKILALLQTRFAGARKDGLVQMARIMALQATTDDEAKALVEKLTEAQINEFIKEFRSDVDKEATEARKTFEANLKKKFDFVEKKADEADDDGKGNGGKANGEDDIASKLGALLDAKLKPLQEKLNRYEQGDIAKTRLQALNDKLAACKDENFKAQIVKDFGKMRFETDDEFNEYLTDKETAIKTANQGVADATLGNQAKPLFTAKNETGVSQSVADYIASKKPENNTFTGKPV